MSEISQFLELEMFSCKDKWY